MTAVAQARRAYEIGNPALRSPRSTEYEAFAQVTRALRSAAMGKGGNLPDRVRALHDNRRLWTLLAASVADPDNALPDDLRARLFYLYEFTTEHTRKILREGGQIEPLLDINAAVMAGLRGGGVDP